MNDKVKKLIFKMLIQNTGEACCDSGGYPKYNADGNYIGSEQGYGRHYEKHKNKTINDFINEPEIFYDIDDNYIISVFHYLTKQLTLDKLCEEFNKLPCEAFDSENGYGISKKQEHWLNSKGYKITDKSYNSYNGDSNLSQGVQYSIVTKIDNLYDKDEYILLQTHNGCDIRGGYSDAKLFIPKSLDEYGETFLLPEDVQGTLVRGNREILFSNMYNGYNLTIEEVNEIEDDNQLKLFDDSEVEINYNYMVNEELIITEKDLPNLTLYLAF